MKTLFDIATDVDRLTLAQSQGYFFCKKGLTFSLWVAIISLAHKESEVIVLGIHKGTRLTDTPKDRTLKVRFDEETENKLNELCEKTGKSKAQVVRDGIEIQYAELEK